jgi:hypothetical protein
MATSNQLERISSLTDRLGPIAKKQRGMRIEAEEWNALVEVLLGILVVDRAQEESTQVALEQRFALKDHEHLGEISLTWLDADLQTRLGGQQAPVSTRTLLAEMEQKVQSLGDEVARLTSLTERQQKLIDRFTVDQADRSLTLKQFETRFSGLENLRTLVSTVASDVDGIRGNVGTLLELRKSLSDAQGNPIDLGKLRTELGDLQGLRENLKGVDGELLRLRDIETKLKEVSDAAGLGGGGLDKRLADISSEMEGRLHNRIDERDSALKSVLQEQTTVTETRMRAELDAGLAARGQALDQSLAGRIAETEVRINTGIDGKVTASADAVRREATDSARALIEARLAGLPDQVRNTTGAMIATLKTDLRNDLRATLTADVQARMGAFESQLNARVSATETKINRVEQELPAIVSNNVDSARSSLEEGLDERVAGRVAAARTALQEALGTQVRDTASEIIGDLDGRINSSLTTRLSGLDKQIVDAVAASTRDVPGQITAELNTQIDALNLDERINTANTKLAQQLRAEQAQASAQQQARTSDAINSSVSLLRGEINGLRTEVNGNLNTRINQSTAELQQKISGEIVTLEGRLKPDSFLTRPVVVQPINEPIR